MATKTKIAIKPTPLDVVVRRALYARLPAQAFKAHDGADWVYVGFQWVNFQGLCEGIAADIAAAGVGQPQ